MFSWSLFLPKEKAGRAQSVVQPLALTNWVSLRACSLETDPEMERFMLLVNWGVVLE